MTCGSVDDGKSTLIGRLLYDAKQIYEDQLAAIRRDSATQGTTGGEFDPALLTDGLRAEREQGITIDVAYRYVSTERRKFIIADTPGHEQYTRNMATGASTCELAIILVDARKGVVTQTRRHSFIVSLLGIRHVIVAVNKMDLVGYAEEVFRAIEEAYRTFAARLDLESLRFIPMSARWGDNVVEASVHMPWYGGDPLLEVLEHVQVGGDRDEAALRFPVQLVIRPDSSFRGFAGTIAAGHVRRGDAIVVLPSRKRSRVASIVTHDGELAEAFAPQSVVLTLADEIDVSRGDMLVRPGEEPELGDGFEATIVWMAEDALVLGKEYLFKLATRTVAGRVHALESRIDVDTMAHVGADTLALNEIGSCGVQLHAAVAFDAYRDHRGTGAFVIIDRVTNATVGAGMIRGRGAGAATIDPPVDPGPRRVTAEERRVRYGQRPATVLLTGRTAADKITLAHALERRLFDLGRAVTVLGGKAGGAEELRRSAEVARLFNDAGLLCVSTVASPNEAGRRHARAEVGEDRFLVVHLEPSIATRDGWTPGGDGLPATSEPTSIPDEPPIDPDLVLDTEKLPIDHAVDAVLDLLEARGVV